MNSLALLYDNEGKYARAELLYSQALTIKRRVLGEEHAETLVTMNNLASLYRNEGKYAEAEPLQTRASMGKPSRCASRPWRFDVECWARSIPTHWEA